MLRKLEGIPFPIEWASPSFDGLRQSYFVGKQLSKVVKMEGFNFLLSGERSFRMTGTGRYEVGYIYFERKRPIGVVNSVIIKLKSKKGELVVDLDTKKRIVGVEMLQISDPDIVYRAMIRSKKFKMDAFEKKAFKTLYRIWHELMHANS